MFMNFSASIFLPLVLEIPCVTNGLWLLWE